MALLSQKLCYVMALLCDRLLYLQKVYKREEILPRIIMIMVFACKIVIGLCSFLPFCRGVSGL